MYSKASNKENFREVSQHREDLEDATNSSKLQRMKNKRTKSIELALRKDTKESMLPSEKDFYEGGSGKKKEKDEERVVNMTQDGIINKKFPNNSIRTAKYSFLTFFPMNLYTQFSKAANLYFLLIAYMQTIKSISISGGKSVMALPLSVIVLISMIKDAYEDYQRHCSDAEENNK